jgi:hypothetical protein
MTRVVSLSMAHTLPIDQLKAGQINQSFDSQTPTEHGVLIPAEFKVFQNIPSNKATTNAVWHIKRMIAKETGSSNENPSSKGVLRFLMIHPGGHEFHIDLDINPAKISAFWIVYDNYSVRYDVSSITPESIVELFKKSSKDVFYSMANNVKSLNVRKQILQFVSSLPAIEPLFDLDNQSHIDSLFDDFETLSDK